MDTRTKLVLEFDVRGAGRGTGEANKMAAAVNNVADAWDDMADAYDEMPDPPADLFDDFIDDVHEAEEAVEDLTAAQKKARAEQDKINKAFDEAAKDAHKAAEATDELTRARKEAAKFKPQEKGPPTSQAERNQIKIADLAEDAQKQQRAQIHGLEAAEALQNKIADQLDLQQESERAALALMQNQEQSAQALAALYDQQARAGQKQVALERQRLAVDVELAALADSGLADQKQVVALQQKRTNLATELAALGDADISAAQQIIALERERAATATKLASIKDAGLTAQRQEIALQQKAQSLAVDIAAQSDATQATERQRLALMKQMEAAQLALASAADGEQESARQKVADIRAAQGLNDQLRQQQDTSLAGMRDELALQQKRNAAAVELAALGDADLVDAQKIIALERERASMATKVEASKDEALTAQRQELAITQKIEALTTELSLLENDAVVDAQRVLAVNKEIEATKAKLAAAQDVSNEATRQELAAIQAKQKLEDSLASIKAQTSDAALNAAQYEEQFLKEKLQLENKLKNLNATDPEYEQTKKNIKLIEDRRALEQKIAIINDVQAQALSSQLDLEQQKLATAKQIADIEAGGSTDKDLAALKEKLGLLEQQQQIEDAIAESKRKAPGGDLADLQALSVVQQTTQDTQDELTKLQAIANDPAMLKQIQQQRALQQQIDLSTRTWRDYINGYAEVLEKMDSSIQAWATFGMAISAAWSVYTSGALSRSIEDATDRMGKMSAAAETYAATHGILTQGQSRQAALRAGEQGVSKGSQGKLGGMAAALGQRAVVLGESDNLGEATIEALKGLQDEFSKGELGDSFKNLGVSVAQYERSVRMAAAHKGVLPEALDRQTRQQILLAQATNDSTGALALYSSEQLKGAQKTENFLQELKAGFGRVVAGDGVQKAFGFDEADLASSEVSRSRNAFLKAKEKSEWTRGTVGGVGGASEGTAASLERATAEAKIAYEQAIQKNMLAESFVLQRGINQELALKTESLLMLGAEGAKELLTLNETFRLEKQRRETREEIARLEAAGLEIPTALDMKLLDINQKLDKNLTASKLISKEDFWQLQKKLTGAHLQNIINEGAATQLTAQSKVAENEAKALKFRLENTKIMGSMTKLEQVRALAAAEFRSEVLKELDMQGKTLEQAEAYLGHAKIQNMLKLEGEKAVNVELMKRDKLMTGEQKQILEVRNLVTDLKLETLGLTTNAAEYHATIGQAVAVQAFEKWGSGAKALAEQFGIGDEALGRMVQKAGNLAGVVDLIAGGGLFTDNFLEKLFAADKDKKDPTGAGAGKKDKAGGGKKDDDMLERLRRERIERQIADAATLGAVTEEAYEHQKDFIEDNLKEVSAAYEATYGDMGAIDQTMRGQLARLEWQYAEGMKQAGDDAAKQKAIKGQLADHLAVLQKEMEARNATFFTSLEEGLGRYASTAQVKLAEASAAWQAHVKEYEVMQQLVADAQKDINARALDNVVVDEVTTSGPQRKLSDGEKGAVNARAEAAAQMKEVLSAHQWSADQKLVIEANYQAKLYEIEQSYNQARFDENQRIRDEMAASAQAALAETQELMSHFSDEARSMSESSQATFQGGLSNIGMKSAEALDGMMAGMIGYIGILGEVDKAKTALVNTEANAASVYAKGAAGIISAGAKAADGVIKSERWKAGVKGAVHTAESIGAFASQDYVGGTMHALAAAKFFVIAGTASEAPAKAKKAEATKRTALSQNTVALSRDRGMTAWTQVFIQLHPITGEAMVSTMNDSARRGNMTGRGIDSRLTRPTATVRTEV